MKKVGWMFMSPGCYNLESINGEDICPSLEEAKEQLEKDIDLFSKYAIWENRVKALKEQRLVKITMEDVND